MTYDVTVKLSNEMVNYLHTITKIEEKSGNTWKEIANPLEFYFDKSGSYRFSNESTNFAVYTTDEISIIFIEVRKTKD